MWRYTELLKQMYASDSGVPTSRSLPSPAGATPSPQSLREISERLSAIEQLLQDLLSRQNDVRTHALLESLNRAIAQHGSLIEKLRADISDLHSRVASLKQQLDNIEGDVRAANRQLRILRESPSSQTVEFNPDDLLDELSRRIEAYLSRIERAIINLKESSRYEGVPPVDVIPTSQDSAVPPLSAGLLSGLKKDLRRRRRKK